MSGPVQQMTQIIVESTPWWQWAIGGIVVPVALAVFSLLKRYRNKKGTD